MDGADLPKKPRSPWFWVAIGCGGALVLGCLGFGALALAGAAFIKGSVDGIADPKVKEQKALQALGGLPEGYWPFMTFAIPMVMDVVILTDRPPPADGGLEMGDRSFLYYRALETGDGKKARAWLEGTGDDAAALSRSGIQVRSDQVLARGSLEAAGTTVHYVVQQGSVQGGQGGDEAAAEGLQTVLLFACKPDGKLRVGIWVEPLADLPQGQDKPDLAGTVGDEARLRAFLQPLTPCAR